MNDFRRVKIGLANVDFGASLISNDQGSNFSIEPKVMKVLHALSNKHGEVVSRNDLIDSVWGNAGGADEGLTRAISLLRKAFGNGPDCKHYIQTIPKRGYRLKAPMIDVCDEVDLAVSPSTLSIAVLPFIDMSDKQNFDYLCDGLSEEIINQLTHLAGLKVSGRTSSFSFKGKNQDIREIAQALSVAYVLEGSLRKDGDQLCITVQLIEGRSGFHISSDTYKGECTELFSFQEGIAVLVANEISKTLNITAIEKINKQQNISTEAYKLFLRGKQLTHRLNGQNTIPTGIDYLQRAVAIEPHFVDALSWLALAHFILPEFSKTELWAEHIDKSWLAVEQALTLDPDSSVALLVKAMHLTHRLKFDAALETYQRALELDPNNVETMAGMGLGLMAIGLYPQAKGYFEQVIERDPLCAIWHTTYGGILLAAGDFNGAEKSFLRSFNLGFGAAAFGVSQLMASRGKVPQAIAFMQEHCHALGPVEAAELHSPVVRKLVLNAYLKQAPVARAIVNYALRRRLSDDAAQPTAACLIGFLFLNKPALFLNSILKKPNPYLGYTIARIWEPTVASKNVRMHADFVEFIEQTTLVSAWKKYGWPEQIKPDNGNNLVSTFSIIG
jgi:TolB-like protein